MTLKLRAKVNFPATVTATGGLQVVKANGIWTVSPKWDDLTLVTTLADPETKQLWVFEPSTSEYSRLTVQSLIDNLPEGPPGAAGPAAWSPPVAWLTATAYVAGPPASVVTEGGETYVCLISHTSGVFATDLAASRWIKVAQKGADGAGTGDFSSNTASSVDGEAVVFSGTGGKTGKRFAATGLVKAVSGVLSAATAGTDYYNPGGTDVALADGGTGASLVDPGADRILFWDDSAGTMTWLSLNAGLEISGTTLRATETHGIALSDETTAITTGTNKATFSLPYAFTVTAVYATLNTVSSSGIPTVDINEAGTTILSTKLTIDASEKTSATAATAAVISDASIAANAEIGFDIDVAGTGAKGLKVFIQGYRT